MVVAKCTKVGSARKQIASDQNLRHPERLRIMSQFRLNAKFFASLTLAVIFQVTAIAVQAQTTQEQPDDAKFANAKVVEISDARLAVIATTGVEHMIAVDRSTKIYKNGRAIAVGELKEGDKLTIELDAASPVKMARRIKLENNVDQLASNNDDN